MLKNSSYLLLIFLILFFAACNSRNNPFRGNQSAPFLSMSTSAVDSILQNMTLEEKAAQLILAVPKSQSKVDLDTIYKKYQLGGFLFERVLLNDFGLYQEHFDLLDSLKKTYKISPLLGFAPDAYESIRDYELLTIGMDSLIQKAIKSHQKENLQWRMNLSFDANINAITHRDSILQDSLFLKQLNNSLAVNYQLIQSYQDSGIITGIRKCVDFHQNEKDSTRLAEDRLFPYQSLAQSGASMILLDTNTFHLDTLKPLKVNAVRNFLVDSLQFGGLAVSYFHNKKWLTEQLRTGTDLFITPIHEVKTAIESIQVAVKNGTITEGTLDYSVKKILMAKQWTAQFSPVIDTVFNIPQLIPDWLEKAEHSVVVLKNTVKLLPFKNTKEENALVIIANSPRIFNFDLPNMVVEKYAFNTTFKKDIEKTGIAEKRLKLGNFNRYDKIIIFLDEYNKKAFDELKKITNKKNTVLIYRGNPTDLKYLDDFKTILYIPDGTEINPRFISQVLSGGNRALGQFPLNVSEKFYFGKSNPLTKKIRLRKALFPEEVGVSSEILSKISEIAREGIRQKAMPSCQIMVIKDGSIIYNEAFGHHTYRKKTPIKSNHLYDLASITKVAATTMAMMKLYQQGKYSLSDSLYQIIGMDSTSNLNYITIRDLLIHQSGLQPNMPINRFLNKKDKKMFATSKKDSANIKIANGFYLYNNWMDTLWNTIKTLELTPNPSYRYSDINANLLQKIVETLTKKPLNQYVDEMFYESLGMNRTLFNPLSSFKKEEIVPTEKDNAWRKQLVHGYVHDESAALQGGVAGNAGLFSTAMDLAVLSQMLLDKGNYLDQSFLQKETIDLFRVSTHGNYRGLGFNKQRVSGTAGCAAIAPLSTFGHTGFTGNCFWIDPENNLIYVFLSNRVYPRRNNRLSKMKIRERIHEVIYNSLGIN
jgi:beta-N-acetylhexosaminidase